MAITNGYCTLAQLKAELGVADTDDDTVLEDSITSASRAIDQWCGRRFYADGGDTTRYFSASSPSTVRLTGAPDGVDLISVTSVTADRTGNGSFSETYTEGTDFHLGPRSAAANGRPYTKLEVDLPGLPWPQGRDRIKVVGTFGWPSAHPPEVERATIALASQFYKQIREAPFGAASFDLEGGVLRMSRYLPGNVEMMVRPFRRVVPGAV